MKPTCIYLFKSDQRVRVFESDKDSWIGNGWIAEPTKEWIAAHPKEDAVPLPPAPPPEKQNVKINSRKVKPEGLKDKGPVFERTLQINPTQNGSTV